MGNFINFLTKTVDWSNVLGAIFLALLIIIIFYGISDLW